MRAFLCPAHAFGGMTIEVHRWQCKEVYDLKRAPLLDSRSGDRGLRGSACGKGEGMRQCDSLRIQYHNVIHTRQRHLPSSSIRYALLALSLTPRSHDRDYLCENMCKKVRETIERIVSRDVGPPCACRACTVQLYCDSVYSLFIPQCPKPQTANRCRCVPCACPVHVSLLFSGLTVLSTRQL